MSRNPRAATTSLRWTDAELDEVRAHARAAGYGQLSAFLRDAALAEVQRARGHVFPPTPPALISVRRVQLEQARRGRLRSR